jgi:formate hydrogenlyase subunit 3/multisubunit Na+/H+ antiporter MnhD subunit
VVVGGKVVLYTVTVIILGLAEHLIEGYRRSGSLGGALALFDRDFKASRFFAIVLCIAMLFAVFFVMQEVNRKMGPGRMYTLFFERPRA